MTLKRSALVSIAAVICILSSAADFTTLASPIPRPVAYGSAVVAVLGLVGAYGIWRLKRWGAVLSVVFLAVNSLLAAPGIPFAPNVGLQLFATLTAVCDLAAIAFLVLPDSRKAYA